MTIVEGKRDTMYDRLKQVESEIVQINYEHWLHYELFTWQWWLLVVLSVVPWILWWRVVDKRRIIEILAVGLFVATIASLQDVYGWNRGMWRYPIQLLPVCIPLLPFDVSVLPIVQMFVYQFFRSWKAFLGVNLVIAFSFAYISEPLLEWMGIYDPIKWKHIYSVPIYVMNAVVAKWGIEKLKKIESRA
ncbi:CBO0543 family protein [Ammoniphilus sp. YIM 78166]|uniref:CBO0543 family protein n=1 Tax=Ammoniphilus sp. YIM 78166 TaxID=1644106 RepID=UPI0014305A6B|nr:CBO0543 family protein [Ammoniphilus sp. YIM 78166]